MITHDVFVSYNHADAAVVEQLARALRERGVEPFLDRWYLEVGRPWVEVLERVLGSCRAALVIAGPSGLGPWQKKEYYLALDRQTRDDDFLLIPVLIPGGDPDLGLLNVNTRVDLRRGLSEAALEELAAAVRGIPPDIDPDRGQETCPYRGLRHFREEDARFYFGREDFIDAAVAALEHRRLLAVVGASGSGKSSAVRAGVLPRLRRPGSGPVWEVVTLVPGEQPFHNLAAALLQVLEPDLSEVARLGEVARLRGSLGNGEVSVREVAARLLEKQTGTDRLLLFVDQWEELYAPAVDAALRTAFIEGLLEATDTRAVHLVFTVRGDFYGHLLAHPGMAELLRERVLNLGPMTRRDLERAIRGPAEEAGLVLQPGLAEHVMDDVADAPSVLPLLQFVMAELWEGRTGNLLTHATYADLGEAEGAIARRAQAIHDALGAEDRRRLRGILLRLVRPGLNAPDTRRRASMDELGTPARDLVNRLAEARLLVIGRDDEGAEVVEIGHEALIHNWGTLQEWLIEDRAFLLWLERFRSGVAEWEASGRDPGGLLRGAPLAQARAWARERPDQLTEAEHAYLDRSHRAEARQRRTRRATVAGAILVALAVPGLLGFWMVIRSEAADTWGRRVLLTAEATPDPLVQALLLAELPPEREPPGGAALARRVADAPLPVAEIATGTALPRVAWAPDGSRLATSLGDTAVLVTAADGRGEPARLATGGAAPTSLAWSAGGAWMAVGTGDGRLLLWRRGAAEPGESGGHAGAVFHVAFDGAAERVLAASADALRLRPLSGSGDAVTYRFPDAEVTAAALAPDGAVAAGLVDGSVWLARPGEPVGKLRPSRHLGTVAGVAFSPDGERLASWSARDPLVLLHHPGAATTDTLRHESEVLEAAFTPDGRGLLTGSGRGAVRLWSLDGPPAPLASLEGAERVWSVHVGPEGRRAAAAAGTVARVAGLPALGGALELVHGAPVRLVRFDPSGRWVVTGATDGTLRVWSAAGPTDPVVLSGHEGAVRAAAFDPDGGRVATASADGTARVWSLEGSALSLLRGHGGEVVDVAWSAAGDRLVTASRDGTARVWDPDGRAAPTVLAGHAGPLSTAAFDPSDAWVLTASDDGTARLWPADGDRGRVVASHAGWVRSARFGPAGRRVVTASGDGVAALVELDGSRVRADTVPGEVMRWAGLSPDGRRVLALPSDGTARLWAADDADPPVVLPSDGRVTAAGFLPDGRRLATAARDGSLRIWTLGGRAALPPFLLGPGRTFESLALHPGGDWLVAGTGDGAAVIVRTDGPPAPVLLTGHGDAVGAVAFSPRGDRVLTASADGTVRVWRYRWAELLPHLRASTTACLSVAQRINLLGEDADDARARHQSCDAERRSPP